MHVPFVPDPFGVIESSLLLGGMVEEDIGDSYDTSTILMILNPATSSTIPDPPFMYRPKMIDHGSSKGERDHERLCYLVFVLFVGIGLSLFVHTCCTVVLSCLGRKEEVVVVEGTTVPPLDASKVKVVETTKTKLVDEEM